MRHIAALLLTLAIAVSCSRSTPLPVDDSPEHPGLNGGQQPDPSEPENPVVPPDDSERPGIDPDGDYAAVKADPTPRYMSSTLNLWFGHPGVLLSHDGKGVTSFIDIDSGRRIDFSCGAVADDNTLESPSLMIDGVAVAVEGRLLHSTPDRRWYLLKEASDHILVIPEWEP